MTVDCLHIRDTGRIGGGTCAIDAAKGPSAKYCMEKCPKREPGNVVTLTAKGFPVSPIPDDYKPSPESATRGRCCS